MAHNTAPPRTTPFFSESKQLDNNYLIRRTSVDFGIPLLTNPQLVKLFAESLARHKRGELLGLDSKSLFDHYKDESEEDTWSGINEFH